MRISDWSSDVCSSDLSLQVLSLAHVDPPQRRAVRDKPEFLPGRTRPPVVAQPGCHREEQSEERQQRGTAAGKIAVQRPQETLRHRLALGYESCDLSRHYVPPDLLIWGSLGATLRRIRYRGGSRKSRQTTGKTEFCQDFRSAHRDRPDRKSGVKGKRR